MTIDINYALERLSTLQIESGGYYGIEITKLSKELGVTPRGLRKQISVWKRSIKGFRNLTKYNKMDEEDEDCIPPSWNNLSEVLHFIFKYVRDKVPRWKF